MKIIIADHYGLCFGVRDAIAQAEQLAAESPLTILGELAHNPLVRQRLARAGIEEGSLQDITSATTPRVLITAHGASNADHARWAHAGFEVADGTCPLVRQAHSRLRRLVTDGYFPVVIGSRGHAEVNGLVGDFPEAAIVGDVRDLGGLPARPRYGVVSQTTQPIEKVTAIVGELRQLRPESDVRFVDTVCQPTKNRQTALRKLLAEADTVVVVGGRNSNNTLQLVAAATAAGRQVIHIERSEELSELAFLGAKVVGLTAGTSTMKETVALVHERLCEIASRLRT